jgi:endonuclease/exonuclease/phosphatase family metal-dependent hydrolase
MSNGLMRCLRMMAACYADLDLRTALLVASDHFPVVVDLDR